MTTSCQSTSVASSQQSAPEDSNAQRLRENQRRSRLRRKEYVASIETQLRGFQRAGAEASREVQVAAKHVVRENRLLRDLLRRKGVSDSEVEAWLKDGAPPGNAGESTSIDKVQKALIGRRPSDGDGAVVAGRRKSTGMVVERTCRGKHELNVQMKKIKVGKEALPPNSATSPSSSSISAFSPTAQDPSSLAMGMTLDNSASTSQISSPMYLHTPGYNSSAQQRPQQPQGELYLFHSFQQQQQSALRGLSDNSMMHHRDTDKQLHVHRIPSPDGHSHSAMQCDAARTMITELQPQTAMEGLAQELCPQGQSEGCVVDTTVLFGVMDRAYM